MFRSKYRSAHFLSPNIASVEGDRSGGRSHRSNIAGDGQMPMIDNPGVNDAPVILFGSLPMVPVGPELLANSVKSFDQNQSSAAALASGGFVLCWRARNG